MVVVIEGRVKARGAAEEGSEPALPADPGPRWVPTQSTAARARAISRGRGEKRGAPVHCSLCLCDIGV